MGKVKAALNRGKTPDFKLMKDDGLVGYCEVKSLFGPEGLQDPPERVTAVRENLPFYRKLGQNVRGAVERLDAENPNHDKPNVIVVVSHTPEIQRKDLIAKIAGLPVPGGERLFMLAGGCRGRSARPRARST
ncbi:hypothetical protein [Bradyrhizobium sp. S3.5.5]|uniref:hypothetical protein n=1 Tax=Bradyrhizobium sp. S3.5.5 TaxID=3156430 RepID=UPI00339B380A